MVASSNTRRLPNDYYQDQVWPRLQTRDREAVALHGHAPVETRVFRLFAGTQSHIIAQLPEDQVERSEETQVAILYRLLEDSERAELAEMAYASLVKGTDIPDGHL